MSIDGKNPSSKGIKSQTRIKSLIAGESATMAFGTRKISTAALILLLAIFSPQAANAHCYGYGQSAACPTEADIIAAGFPGGMFTECGDQDCCLGHGECCLPEGASIGCGTEPSSTTTTTLMYGTCDVYPLPNHCCPTGYEYDLTFRCCMPENQAVRLVEMYDRRPMEPTDPSMGLTGNDCCVDVGYCEEKMRETGQPCMHGEGPCRNVTRDGQTVNECGPGLSCAQSYFSTSKWETASCGRSTQAPTSRLRSTTRTI